MMTYSFKLWVEAKEDQKDVETRVFTLLREKIPEMKNATDDTLRAANVMVYSNAIKMQLLNCATLDVERKGEIRKKINSETLMSYTVADFIKDLITEPEDKQVNTNPKTFAPKHKLPPSAQNLSAGPTPQAPVPPPPGPTAMPAAAPTAIPPQG